jgi:hypothetical protein
MASLSCLTVKNKASFIDILSGIINIIYDKGIGIIPKNYNSND